jgi:hypothetical protein
MRTTFALALTFWTIAMLTTSGQRAAAQRKPSLIIESMAGHDSYGLRARFEEELRTTAESSWMRRQVSA